MIVSDLVASELHHREREVIASCFAVLKAFKNLLLSQLTVGGSGDRGGDLLLKEVDDGLVSRHCCRTKGARTTNRDANQRLSTE